MQSYKLRLGDGTFLVVDFDGLSAWLRDEGAMVQVIGSQRWSPLKQFVAQERAARQASRVGSAGPDALPLVYPKPREDEPPRVSVGEAPGVQVLADEPGVSGPFSGPHPSTADDDIPVIPLKPQEDEPAVRPAAPSRTGPLKPVPVIVPASPPVRASVPVAPLAEEETYRPTDHEQRPAIPRKPLIERALGGAGFDDADAIGEALPGPRLTRTLLRAASRLGAFLSRCLDPVNRLERGLSPFSPPEGKAPWDASDSPPSAVREQEPSVRAREPAVSLPPSLEAPGSLKPPPSISELPSLRLAPTDEPEEPGDLYGEGDVYGRVRPVHAVWLWTKRFVLIAGLVAGSIWAVLSWETWVPKATELGRVVFTEMDARVQVRYQAKRRERVLLETVQQVPHLSPGTIDLLFSSSPTGILDPPEVFRLACAAADQGVSALTAEEAQELTRLRRQLLETLTPAERELVDEYDLVRARRATFTFEDQGALRLFARAARALPPRSLERLQALSGKAIAAGLAKEGAPRPRVES